MRFDVTIDSEAARQITMNYIAENMILFKSHYVSMKKLDKLSLSKAILLNIAPNMELDKFAQRFDQESPTEINWNSI
jgi:hypothetical protein